MFKVKILIIILSCRPNLTIRFFFLLRVKVYLHFSFFCSHSKVLLWACMCMCLVAQSCLTLCDPMDCSPPGSSIHGILQARILEWVAMPCSRRSYQPRDQTTVFCTAGRFFISWATRETRMHQLKPTSQPMGINPTTTKWSLCILQWNNLFLK